MKVQKYFGNGKYKHFQDLCEEPEDDECVRAVGDDVGT